MIKDNILLKLIKVANRNFNEKQKEKAIVEQEIENAKKLITAIHAHLDNEAKILDQNPQARFTWENFLHFSLDRINILEIHIKQQSEKLKILEEEILELYKEEKKFKKLKENQDIALFKKQESDEQKVIDEVNIRAKNMVSK
ncbi:MAG: hypothetical protein ACK5AV_07500 [Alphaproteobacteria bacterium]|nr:flagellar FliJ family protein [Candidatus Jidaibacter sp.]